MRRGRRAGGLEPAFRNHGAIRDLDADNAGGHVHGGQRRGERRGGGNNRGDNRSGSRARLNTDGSGDGDHARYSSNNRGSGGASRLRGNRQPWRGDRHNEDGRGAERRTYPMSVDRMKELLHQPSHEVLMILTSGDNSFRTRLSVGPIRHQDCSHLLRVDECYILGLVDHALKCNTSSFRRSLIDLMEMFVDSSYFREVLMPNVATIWPAVIDAACRKSGSVLPTTANLGELCAPVVENLTRICRIILVTVQSAQTLVPQLKPVWQSIQQLMVSQSASSVVTSDMRDLQTQLETFFEDYMVNLTAGLTTLHLGDGAGSASGAADSLETGRGNSKNSTMIFERQPPDSFRALSIMPTRFDIFPDEEPFVRPNKIDGKYENVEHYLDVQFRLLREDFIAPIREGVTLYRDAGAGIRSADIRVYTDARIGPPDVAKTGEMVNEVSFSVKKLGKVKWEVSKRLIFGALVCLSNDNFNTMFFGTVFDRSVRDLAAGLVTVNFAEKVSEASHAGKTAKAPFLMVESSVFFEAYRPVLSGIQRFDVNSFPFARYLVDCNPVINAPAYNLRLGDHLNRWDFLCLINPANPADGAVNPREIETMKMRSRNVSILDLDQWPGHEAMGLDELQYKALQLAMTKELALIQGPPGTGKTFIGYKIVQLLLQNGGKWNPAVMERVPVRPAARRSLLGRMPSPATQEVVRMSPILVVCYTNHALDQFLDGIRRFQTEGIVRVGGRCQAPELEQFLLKNVRKKAIVERTIPKQLSREFYDLKCQAERSQHCVRDCAEMEKRSSSGLLKYSAIEKYLTQSQTSAFQHFLDCQRQRYMSLDNALKMWLVDGFVFDRRFDTRDPRCFGFDDGDDMFKMEDSKDSDLAKEVTEILAQLDGNDGQGGLTDEEVEKILKQINAQNNQIDDDNLFDLGDPRGQQPRRDDFIGDDFVRPVAADFDDGWQLAGGKDYKKKLKDRITKGPRMGIEESKLSNQIWQMSMKDRWRLYRCWLAQYLGDLNEDREKHTENYRGRLEKLQEHRMLTDEAIFRAAKVIGLTTTGAARYQSVLQLVKPRIVIVEEAAEVLEGHILTCLSSGCEHLILIGDHFQLRPNPAVYRLAVKYNLEISLFERLVKNKLDLATLSLQHRMRPQIADILMPHFYRELRNDESVYSYPSVLGVARNLMFIKHEDHHELDDGDSHSHKNLFESEYVSGLAQYLVQQGYRPSQITILTPYVGQLFEIKKSMKRYGNPLLTEIKVTAVDNFQGEENDIIILSMVRSNSEGKIGFLATKNRVCVALSRAKHGLFCIGNFDLFAQKEKTGFWRDIRQSLMEVEAISDQLTLTCQIHSTENVIVNPEDFKKLVPEGGCNQPCLFRLDCGHVCKRLCHPIDPEHTQVKCIQKCAKKCPNDHSCGDLCHKCEKACRPCRTKMTKSLKCGHTKENVNCGANMAFVKCTHPCDHVMDCGHLCSEGCGSPHQVASQCVKIVEKRRKCGHTVKIECHVVANDVICRELTERKMPICGHIVKMECNVDVSRSQCNMKCGALLKCLHTCIGTCAECLTGRVHVPCAAKCGRILVCGHACGESCCKPCPPCKKPCENECIHSKCTVKSKEQLDQKNSKKSNKPKLIGRTCGEPCPPCMEKCAWQCAHLRCDLECHEVCRRRRCDEACSKRLKCGHPCMGYCAEPCPKICRECNPDIDAQVGLNFWINEDEPDAKFVTLPDCGHVFEGTSLDTHMCTDNSSDYDDQPDGVGAVSEIQMKKCPACQTPVRRSQRYGPIVKACLKNVEDVKTRMRGLTGELVAKRIALIDLLEEHEVEIGAVNEIAPKFVKDCHDMLTQPYNVKKMSQIQLIALENSIRFAIQIAGISENFKKNSAKFADCCSRMEMLAKVLDLFRSANVKVTCSADSAISSPMDICRVLNNEIQFLMTWVFRNFRLLSEQIFEDFEVEVERVKLLVSIGLFLCDKLARSRSLDSGDVLDLMDNLKLLQSMTPISSEIRNNIARFTRVLYEKYPDYGLNVSEKERIEIVRAIGLSTGHWFKCPNGHIYAIGECGGAMQKSKCPECSAVIGGASHRLQAGNQLAGEMDGATAPAWPTAVM